MSANLFRYVASKVRNGLSPDPIDPAAARMDSLLLDEFCWADLVPMGAGMAGIAAALVTGNSLTASSDGLRQFKKWTDVAAGLGKMKTGITTVTEFASWVVEQTRHLMTQYFPSASVTTPLAAQFSSHKIDIAQYMKDVAHLTNPTRSDDVYRDPQTTAKTVELVRIAALVQQLDATQQVSIGAPARTALSVLRRDLLAFSKTLNSCMNCAAKRPTPFVVSLYGVSGAGKSDITPQLVNDLTNPAYFTEPLDRDDDGYATVISKNSADQYFTGYRGQAVVILDDFGQSAQDTATDSEYLAFIFMVSGTTYPVNMASLDDKGRLFDSRLIVTTTNSLFPRSLCVKTPEALWRRRNFVVEVIPIPGTNIDDVYHHTYNLINPCPLDRDNRATEKIEYLAQNLTYYQLIERIVPAFSAFCNRDNRAVSRKSRLTPQQVATLSASLAPRVVLSDPGFDEVDLTDPVSEMHCYTRPNPLEAPPTGLAPAPFFVTPLICECCDEEQTNLADICCTANDSWHPMNAGVPEGVYGRAYPTACAQYGLSAIEPDWFLHTFDEATPLHHYALLQALQTGDVRIFCPPNLPKKYTRYTNNVLERTSYAALADNLPHQPFAYTWKTLRNVWNFLRTMKKLDVFHWLLPDVPPRSSGTWFRLDKEWRVSLPQPAHQHGAAASTSRNLRQDADDVTVRSTPLTPAEEMVRHLYQETLHEMTPEQRVFVKTVPMRDFETIAVPGAQPAHLKTILLDLAQIRLDNRRATGPELEALESQDAAARQALWHEDPLIPSTVKLVFTGLGVALAGFAVYKVHKWLSAEGTTISIPNGDGSVEEVRCSIRKNFKGVAADLLLAAASTAAVLASAVMNNAPPSTVNALMESFGYDGRAKFLRQGKTLRANMHGLQTLCESEIDDVIEIYAKELGQHISPENLGKFRVAARARITKVFAEHATQEGCSDNRTNDVIEHKLKTSNSLLGVRTRNSSQSVATNGIGLRGKLALFPFHLFHDMEDQEETLLTISGPNGDSTHALTMGVTIIRTATDQHVESRDLCLVDLGQRAQAFKDITPHFISEEDLQSMTSVPAVLVATNPKTKTISQFISYAVRENQATTYGDESEQYLLPTRWRYGITSYPGMCGSPVLCLNSRSSGCLMGMHTAGAISDDAGFAAILTREWLEQQISTLYPEVGNCHCGPAPEDGLLSAGLDPNLTFSSITTPTPPRYPTVTPEGRTRLAAYLNPKRSERITAKTDLRPSPLHDMVSAHATEPAVLHPNDSRCETKISPMNEGAKKYSAPTIPFSPLFVKRAAIFILATLQTFAPKGVSKRVLTMDEGINGIPAANFTRINPLTSPGLPFKWWKPAFAKGKRFLFDCTNLPNDALDMKLKDAYLITSIGEMHEKLLRGEQSFILSYSNLKDERRSLEKVRTGATRLFDCMPLHYNIECRRFFGAFIACMAQNCTSLPSAVGINALGHDWTLLYNRLNRFGGKVIAGDYKAWDGKLDPDVMFAAVEVVNKWYDDGPQNALARHTLLEQMIHLKTVYGNTVVSKSQGIPSGVPITADLNGLCNWFYILIALQHTAAEKGIKFDLSDCSDQLELSVYGDDHIVAPSAEIREWFSFHDVQKFFVDRGIGYTDALKKGGVQPRFLDLAHDTTFLKRRFVPHPKLVNLVLAPIETQTILEEINWIREDRSQTAIRDAMYQNLATVEGEAYHHGREYFTQLQNDINRCLSLLRDQDLRLSGSSDWCSLTKDFRSYDEDWLACHV